MDGRNEEGDGGGVGGRGASRVVGGDPVPKP